MGGKRPIAVMCYICGREYGTKSIDIHIPQCKKKWVMVESQKPVKDRRPLPEPPTPVSIEDLAASKGVSASSMTSADIQEAQNDMAFKAYNEKALVPCEFCGRTFLPEKLVVHNRVCRPGNVSKPVGKSVNKAKVVEVSSPGSSKLDQSQIEGKRVLGDTYPKRPSSRSGAGTAGGGGGGGGGRRQPPESGHEEFGSKTMPTSGLGSRGNALNGAISHNRGLRPKSRGTSSEEFSGGNSTTMVSVESLEARVLQLEDIVMGAVGEIQALKTMIQALKSN